MVDFYQVLGVGQDATPDQIKVAYRKRAFALHPDTNPGNAGSVARAQFHELQEAYGVLRDEGRRAQYDRMLQAGFSGTAAQAAEAAAGGGGFGMPWGQPSMGGRGFDDVAFDEWWKRMSQEFDEYEERQYARERDSAERMARAAAWEQEKAEARANKARTQRLKWRAEDARLQRHASVLRRFWQTHHGFTAADALVAGLFLAGTAGIALAWRGHLQDVRQRQQEEQQQEGGAAAQQEAEQQAGAVRLPAAAAMAAASPAAAGSPS